MIKGLVNRIIPFSSVDGPGNRTAIFLEGCNFN
ncbi:MAG: glycine radical enzyme activase, partial [Clostridiaceae bacterium]|nr:glycine radical enzyme activase [Clostridiaceae bacterium]